MPFSTEVPPSFRARPGEIILAVTECDAKKAYWGTFCQPFLLIITLMPPFCVVAPLLCVGFSPPYLSALLSDDMTSFFSGWADLNLHP
jgi:hypothetical protein